MPMTGRFEQLRSTWDHLGAEDPLWAILTDPTKRGKRWDLGEFLATGQSEIDSLMHALQKRFPNTPRGTAIDFGCGVGRLSRALASYFNRVIGIDVAASMVREAQRLNADVPGCNFLLNEKPDLSLLPSASADLVYSSIVLQHMDPDYAVDYVREFVRLLSPEGVAVFQAPYALDWSLTGFILRLSPVSLLRIYRRLRYSAQIAMNALPAERVRTAVCEAGGGIAFEMESPAAGPGWRSRTYFAVRTCGGHLRRGR
jgi:SAM-dependent methyltransferase